ncbi:MAG: hypothetical protein GAK28_00566 [Luteibacter sp.]|nr:MAG: hypothetical protein GAK28_00566 [Luteibacter sp.]
MQRIDGMPRYGFCRDQIEEVLLRFFWGAGGTFSKARTGPLLRIFFVNCLKPPPRELTASRLQGRGVFVTGASSGIGESTVPLFAREEATVIAAARRAERDPFKGLAQNIPDVGRAESGGIGAFAPQANHEIAAAKGGSQKAGHEKADMKSAWSVQQQRLWHVIPRVIPEGINRGPAIFPDELGRWTRLVEVAGVEPAHHVSGSATCRLIRPISGPNGRNLLPCIRRHRRYPATVHLHDHRPVLVTHHAGHPHRILASAQ